MSCLVWRIGKHTHTHTNIYIYIYIYSHIYTYTHNHAWTHTRACYTHIYIYSHIYTYTHLTMHDRTHTHTHKEVNNGKKSDSMEKIKSQVIQNNKRILPLELLCFFQLSSNIYIYIEREGGVYTYVHTGTYTCICTHSDSSLCDIMAGDFVLYILPFGLVRLRTFRLVHGLVRSKHGHSCSRARGADVSFRDVTLKIPDRG